jgi:tripartite-type tricarboxylate transporter receptor subunit TctC
MCFSDPVTGLPQVKAGTVHCLGVGSRGRYKLAADVPTLIEQGIPDFEPMDRRHGAGRRGSADPRAPA